MKWRILEQGGSYYPQYHSGRLGSPWMAFQSAFTGEVSYSSHEHAQRFLKTLGIK